MTRYDHLLSHRLPWHQQYDRGQALPMAVSLAALGALSLVMLYNVGQIIAARARLIHVADAAAYSGALVQARALNLLAYINRAQVAHQVAMAHLVTLASWAQFGQSERQHLLQGNPPAALISLLFGATHGKAYASSVGVQNSTLMVQDLMRAYTQHDQVVHRVLAVAANATVNSVPVSRQQAIQAVVHANYPEFDFPFVGEVAPQVGNRLVMRIIEDDWPGFIQPDGAGHADTTFRSLVLQATQRYDFLAPRQGMARNTWPVSWRCPLWRHELRRRGETILGATGTWKSTDTQSFHKLRSNRYIGCYYREYVMGFGNTAENSDWNTLALKKIESEVPRDFSKQNFWRWVQQQTRWDIVQGTSNSLALAYAAQAKTNWGGNGLPPYIEVPALRAPRSTRFVLALQQPASLLATTDARSTLIAPIGRFLYQGLHPHETMRATSAAHVYFARPTPRADGGIEIATLFRPYWHARLSAVPTPLQLR